MKCFGLKNNSLINNNKNIVSSSNLNEKLNQLEPSSAPLLSESSMTKKSSTIPPFNKNIVPSLNKKLSPLSRRN